MRSASSPGSAAAQCSGHCTSLHAQVAGPKPRLCQQQHLAGVQCRLPQRPQQQLQRTQAVGDGQSKTQCQQQEERCRAGETGTPQGPGVMAPTRRMLLASGASLGLASYSLGAVCLGAAQAATLPDAISAAANAGIGGGGGSLWESLGAAPSMPDAVRFPRSQIDLPFAVLLMRSGYDAVDDLDFIAMDKFQISFWKLRQSEYEPYMFLYDPLKIKAGDLTDAKYFDFISFSQYATISKEIPRGQTVFQERCEECEGYETVEVVRGPGLPQDNAQLPAAFQRLAGDKIYDGLRNGFRGVQYGGPEPCSPDKGFEGMVEGVRRILDIFVDHGYALKVEVRDVTPSGSSGRGGSFTVHMEGPATLWGLAALAARRSLVTNSFEAMAIGGYLRASGLSGSYSLSRSDTSVDERWEVA